MRAYEIKAERGREVTLETPDFLEQARQLLSSSPSSRSPATQSSKATLCSITAASTLRSSTE